MNILNGITIIFLSIILFTGCEMIDYHPYDVRIDGETDINAKNITRIETSCGKYKVT